MIRLALAIALLTAGNAQAQQLRTYTESQTGPQFLTYGLPVPLPIESLTPVDGFRSYASLEARLQGLALESPDLTSHDVGRTFNGRPVWAYVTGDADATDVEGRPEAAFFINATTHAREWAAPEVATGTIERLIAGANDGGIVRYLLDNTRLVILPVHNIDGFLQTQRYPTEVLVGQDPDVPEEWPRDGRMRRKNMRGVDEILTTTADHLLGIDLNRNHPPFWATTPSRSSPNVNSLVHHGTGPHTEPENQALLNAAKLAPESRIRLGIDLHSHSRVFYSSNTARVRLNTIQRDLIQRLSDHHAAVAGARYPDVQDPPNRGIGTASEYFSYQWLVPGWTLELEPGDGQAAEYGGTNVTHGGFILPASQARRVREGWAETHLVAFYRMAGPPHLARVRFIDKQTGALAMQSRWRYEPATARRVREVTGSLAPQRRYVVELGFSKPMRWRNAEGAVAPPPGGTGYPLAPSVSVVYGSVRLPLDTTGGQWIDDPARVLRYRDDTFVFEFDTRSVPGEYRLDVGSNDMTDLQLDADPATPADWSQGAWSGFESGTGPAGDIGGFDTQTDFSVAAAVASQVDVISTDVFAGEGDLARVRVARRAGNGTLQLFRTDVEPRELVTTWAAGGAAERTIFPRVPDNVLRDGEHAVTIPFLEVIDGVPGANFSVNVRVLDNDDADRVVWRAASDGALLQGFNAMAQLPRGELVLDAGSYQVPFDLRPVDGPGLAIVTGKLGVHGNGATLGATNPQPGAALFATSPNGDLSFDRVRLSAFAGVDSPTPDDAIVRNQGTFSARRSTFTSPGRSNRPYFHNTGQLRLERSALAAQRYDGGALILQAAGQTTLQAGTVMAALEEPTSGALFDVRDGVVVAFQSTLSGYPIVLPGSVRPPRLFQSLVQEIIVGVVDARPACTTPLFDAQGGNVFTSFRAAGAPPDFSQPGCLSLTDSDRYLPDAAIRGTGVDRLLALDAAHPAAAFTQCRGVDQRGAPRPQNVPLVPGGEPRCSAGAYERGLDVYRGIWQPARSGHGVDIQTVGNSLFLAWYTYDDAGEPTAYQATAPFTGPSWTARLQQSSRNTITGAIAVRDVGTVAIDFTDAAHGTLRWNFTDGARAGSEAIAASFFAPGESRTEVTGLWYPPADSGYGATVTRRGDATAIGLYYYDAQGKVRWALGTGNGDDAQVYAMTSFTGFCPNCEAAQNPVTGRAAGTLRAHFQMPREARFEMQLTYPGSAGGTWNRAGAFFVPLNDLVDNSELTPAAAVP